VVFLPWHRPSMGDRLRCVSSHCAPQLRKACGLQAADFLFGAAQPHDPQFEQLFRLFAAGNLGAATAAFAISVRSCSHGDGRKCTCP